MRRHATTIVLFVLAVVLGAWLFADRDKVTEGERKRRDHDVFGVWRKDDLSRIEIAHDGETIVLERDPKADTAWRMTAPRKERVDQAAAERLLTTLEFATVVRKVALGDGLGLGSPRARGELTMGTVSMRFALGARTARPEGGAYFFVDERPPFVVSKELTDALLAPSDTYRDRTVVPYLSLDLARFEVQHPGGGFAVVRDGERSFREAGANVLASRTALDKVWGALAEMRAEAFPKDADADRLTASPRLTIRMTPREPGSAVGEIVAGEPCPGHPDDVVVLRRSPGRVAACAPKGAIESLLATVPAALIDRRPFSLRHDEIEELRLERVGEGTPHVFEAARRGSGFHLRQPDDRELTPDEADVLGDLLVQIEHSEATSVTPGGGAPFAPIAKATARAGAHEEVVEVGDGMLRRVRDDARLAVTPAIARRLVPRATTARARRLVDEKRAPKRVLTVCGTPQELVDEGSGLRLVKPAGYETDGAIAELVDALLRGKGIAWVADADDGTFGLDSPCRVVVSFADGNGPLTFRFGAEGEGGVYGAIDGRPEVFVAPISVLTLVKRIFVSRGALRVDPARIESVKVTRRGTPVTLREPAAAVSALYADRVVSIGSSDVGAVDVTIAIKVAEGGPDKRVSCGPAIGRWRRCSVPDVKAVFDVLATTVDALLPEPDASAP